MKSYLTDTRLILTRMMDSGGKVRCFFLVLDAFVQILDPHWEQFGVRYLAKGHFDTWNRSADPTHNSQSALPHELQQLPTKFKQLMNCPTFRISHKIFKNLKAQEVDFEFALTVMGKCWEDAEREHTDLFD